METRVNNLIYEHKHDGYGWHPKTRIHKEPEYQVTCECGEIIDIPYHRYSSTICENCGEKITAVGINVCIICNVAKPAMQFDEFLGGNICDSCANNREVLILSK